MSIRTQNHVHCRFRDMDHAPQRHFEFIKDSLGYISYPQPTFFRRKAPPKLCPLVSDLYPILCPFVPETMSIIGCKAVVERVLKSQMFLKMLFLKKTTTENSASWGLRPRRLNPTRSAFGRPTRHPPGRRSARRARYFVFPLGSVPEFRAASQRPRLPARRRFAALRVLRRSPHPVPALRFGLRLPGCLAAHLARAPPYEPCTASRYATRGTLQEAKA
jgi:hypothetical protein